ESFVARHFGQALEQPGANGIAEGERRRDQLTRLAGDRRDQRRVGVAEARRALATDAIDEQTPAKRVSWSRRRSPSEIPFAPGCSSAWPK
ncbi:MAG: hypothetical protein AAFY88_27825, partial [Acidobacteriota bacterium]